MGCLVRDMFAALTQINLCQIVQFDLPRIWNNWIKNIVKKLIDFYASILKEIWWIKVFWKIILYSKNSKNIAIVKNYACFSIMARMSSTSSLEPRKIGERTWSPVGSISKIGFVPLLAFPPAFSTMYAWNV